MSDVVVADRWVGGVCPLGAISGRDSETCTDVRCVEPGEVPVRRPVDRLPDAEPLTDYLLHPPWEGPNGR